MKKITTLITCLVASTSLALAQTSNEVAVSNYTKINNQSSSDVQLVARATEGVELTCSDELKPFVLLEVKDQCLRIDYDWAKLEAKYGKDKVGKHNYKKTNNRIQLGDIVFNTNLYVKVYVKNIEEIKTVRSGKVYWERKLPSTKLRLICKTSGAIEWEGLLQTDKLDVEIGTSAVITGDSQVKEANIEISTSGEYYGDIKTKSIQVKASTSGSMKSKIFAETAVFRLSTSSEALISGYIKDLDIKATTSGSFIFDNLHHKTLKQKTSTGGSIELP